ncbi:hypothetical protein L484_006868 [Morus notabilis]|uniref:RRP15-like protein n=1 Tax=Morus notabilis TaxID=981085 RepID=W9S4P7_9ROSA|nr:RRP15-like protein [Morus notabilis]EXC15604.1 hypothetical protein L484_006868 [Morus notabilis]
MVEEKGIMESTTGPKKRKFGKRKNPKMMKTKKKKKKVSHFPEGVGELKPKKSDRDIKKLFRKRARDYNSDEEESEDKREENDGDGDSSEAAEELENQEVNKEDNEFSDVDEAGEIQPGITKFTEGCRAFRMAFKSIIKKAVNDDPLGPVLSAHKKLVAEKLAEEEAERKVKGQTKKEKHLVGEKGHVKPATYLDSHEKFLIGVATKGVVKLFNAVNKAQHAQKGLNPSSFKDKKAIRKRRKEAFFTELGKTPSAAVNATAKLQTSSGQADDEGPAWAPLRDNYMLTSSKLKDWDKMPDKTVTDEIGNVSEDSSSDDD